MTAVLTFIAFVAGAPTPQGALEGLVDGLAPVTWGVGHLVSSLIGANGNGSTRNGAGGRGSLEQESSDAISNMFILHGPIGGYNGQHRSQFDGVDGRADGLSDERISEGRGFGGNDFVDERF
ncbi:hypothetical protein H4R20_001277 [Coemansia guatemalensis]|uniref:Uncharacterized protein n=1 Tax=Coemansia guatemalensis TaxID=2761395 RepID=A0A9W8I4N5_9FUNG|nr:hypothetical protein H4R20_001277 [Coemansia guatemalensis]